MPHANPSHPWALAGAHMAMRTYLLTMIERETDIDYWVNATIERGPLFVLDDITGLCKFAMVDAAFEAEALRVATGLDVSDDELLAVVHRTVLRGYAAERRQGFTEADYAMPAEAHEPLGHSTLPQFNTPEFFAELRDRVLETLDERARAAGFL